jgi:hypothetical protein
MPSKRYFKIGTRLILSRAALLPGPQRANTMNNQVHTRTRGNSLHGGFAMTFRCNGRGVMPSVCCKKEMCPSGPTWFCFAFPNERRAQAWVAVPILFSHAPTSVLQPLLIPVRCSCPGLCPGLRLSAVRMLNKAHSYTAPIASFFPREEKGPPRKPVFGFCNEVRISMNPGLISDVAAAAQIEKNFLGGFIR